MPLCLLGHGHDEPGDRGIVGLQLARPTQDRRELGEQLRFGGGRLLEVGVDAVDGVAIHGRVQLGLRLEVVVDRTGRDTDVVGNPPVRRGSISILSEPDPRSTKDPSSRLRRVARWWPPDAPSRRHAATVPSGAFADRTVRHRTRPARWQTVEMDAPADKAADLSFDQIMELDRRADQRQAEAADRAAGSGGVHGNFEQIVLPWWQHPVNVLTLVVTAAILAGMVGWMIGDSGSRIKHNEVDTGFLQDMREHHEQAVLMGFIFRGLPDTDPGLRTIAAGIVRGQSMEVGRMIQLLRDYRETEANETDTSMTWMGMSAAVDEMPGMASDDEIEQLGLLAGQDADRLFVALMTEHHIGGIEMASFAAANAQTEEVRAMASAMASAQRGEIVEMEKLVN